MMFRKILLIHLLCVAFVAYGCDKPKENPPSPPPVKIQIEGQSAGLILSRARELINAPDRQAQHFKQAKKLIQKAVKTEPANDAILVEGGSLLYSNAPDLPGVDSKSWGPNSAKAKELFWEALRINPNNEDAHLALGAYYWYRDNKDIDKAAEHWQKYIELDTSNPKPYYRLAQYYIEKKQYEKAEKSAKKAIEIAKQGDDPLEIYEGKCVLGGVLVEQGKFDQAEKILKEISKTQDGDHWACAYQGLGVLYHKMGRTKELAESMKVIADGQKDLPLAAYIAALRFFDTGDFALADHYVSHALTIETPNRFKILKAYLLLLNKDFDAAKKIFNEVLQNDPADPGTAIGLGHLDIINRNYAKAASRIKPLVDTLEKKLGPNKINNNDLELALRLNFKMAALGMGWVMANRNRHAEANKYYDRALVVSPDDLLLLLGKGNSLIGRDKLYEAEKTFEKVLSIDPENQYALAELALVKFKKGQTEKAQEIFNQALEKGESQYTCPHEGLGMVYLRQGKVEQAKESFQKAIALNPDIEFKKFNELAKIYISEGRYKKARKLLTKSIENFPYDKEAKTLLESIKDK